MSADHKATTTPHVESDIEATSAVERAQAFFTTTTAPAFLPAVEAQFVSWMKRQATANRKVVVITSGGTTVPLEKNTVRFIDNFSTGGRGAACTEYFLDATSDAAHAKSDDKPKAAAAAGSGGYAVLLLRRAGSVCPYARHVQKYLLQQSAAAGGFDWSLLNTIQSFSPETGSITVKPKAVSSADAGAALQKQLTAYRLANENDRLLSFEFTSITEYLFLFRAAAVASAPLKQNAILFLAAAVSDFYVPESTQTTHKIQSSGGPLNITLPQVPKLLKLLKSHWAPHSFAVSFKLETDDSILFKKAYGAIVNYGMDAVIANQLNTRNDRIIIVTTTKPETATAAGSSHASPAPTSIVLTRRPAAKSDTAAAALAGPAPEIESVLCRAVAALHAEFIASAGARTVSNAAGTQFAALSDAAFTCAVEAVPQQSAKH